MSSPNHLKWKSPSNNKPLRKYAPPRISPAKKPFEQILAQGLLSEFYGIYGGLKMQCLSVCIGMAVSATTCILEVSESSL